MTGDLEQVEILVVEDNPNDYELTARALKKINLANKVFWVKDGAEALEFIFCTGKYTQRSMVNGPRLILLDLKLPNREVYATLNGKRTKVDSSGFEATQGGWDTGA